MSGHYQRTRLSFGWIVTNGGINIPHELYLPSLILCVSLFLDLIQYVVSSISWYIFYLRHRKADENDDNINVKESEYINLIPWLLFVLKVISTIIGYICIGAFLISKI